MAEHRPIRKIENKPKNRPTTPINNQSHMEFQSSRELRYRCLEKHSWYAGVIFDELTEADRKFIEAFLGHTTQLSDDQFRISVNRLFIDDADKPARYAIIQEVLSCL